MLPKHKRLAAASVREILKRGRAVHAGALTARVSPAASSAAAVVVSKKIAKTAVERNRMRRAVYRALSSLLPARTHVVVFVQKKVTDYSHDIETLCSKLS